jgi:hypothetical protein
MIQLTLYDGTPIWTRPNNILAVFGEPRERARIVLRGHRDFLELLQDVNSVLDVLGA